MIKKLHPVILFLGVLTPVYAKALTPNSVVTCTATQCPHILPILSANEALNIQAIVYQTSSKPEFMQRFEKDFANKNNGGWQQIVIDESAIANTQPIVGFGGAFTDSAAMLYQQMSPALQNEFINAYFSNQGMAYSMGRVPVASNDFSCRKAINGTGVPSLNNCSNLWSLYSYADLPEEDLKHFALQAEDLNYKIPMLKAALNTAPTLRLFASAWSAPAWMKTNGSMVHGSLNANFQQAWANYFIKFFEAYKNNGIQFWGLTVQNEPEENLLWQANNKGMQTWQTMYLSKEQEANLIKNYLGPTLKNYENSYGSSIHLMMHDGQITTINDRVNIIKDENVARYVDGAGLHWYMNGDNNYSNLNAAYQTLNADQKNRFILATEACEGYLPFFPGPDLGSWPRGEAYGHDIMSDLNHHVSGWVDWNLVLDKQGGPNWANNKVDAPILFDLDKQIFYEQPMYFYLGHFSKFIRPGSQLLASHSNGPFSLEEVTFKVPAYNNLPATIVVVVLNRDITGRTYYIKDTSIQNENKYLNLSIPGHAIQTIIFKQQGQ